MFIELESVSGRKVVLNENGIVEIWERDEGAEIYTVTAAPGEYGIRVKESRSQILKMIGPVKVAEEKKVERVEVEVNFNETVKVKLTPFGRAILKERIDKLNDLIDRQTSGRGDRFDYSSFSGEYYHTQMWSLMSTFGDHMGLGKETPFDAQMIIKGHILEEKGAGGE